MLSRETYREEKGAETVPWDKPKHKEEEGSAKNTKKEWQVR